MFYELPVQFSFYKRQTDYSTKFLLFMNKKPVNLACDETLLTHKKGTWELDSMYWLCIQKCVAQAKLKLEKTGKGGWEILCLDIIGGARRWLTQDTLTHNQFMNFSQIKMYDISQARPQNGFWHGTGANLQEKLCFLFAPDIQMPACLTFL